MQLDEQTQAAGATLPERTTCYGENARIFAARPCDPTFERRCAATLPLAMEEQPSSILDIGCGRGELLRRVPATIRRCGVDCLDPAEVSPHFDYVQCDIGQAIPCQDHEFDVVLAGEVIEHLLDTVGFLRECRRILRPSGVLVLTTPNLAYWRNLLQWVRQQQFFFVDHRAGENGHVRYFAPRTLRAAVTEAGFCVERLFSVGDLPTSTNILLRAIGKVSVRWCPMRNLSLIVKARRLEA
jgi:2-polyprenyl-3-methyl-5-hydroxy-6-metoxy-1,4-benzoquinol methylase